MLGFKVDLNYGIQIWASRMDDFWLYLPHMLWDAGESCGEKRISFSEHEMQENLDGSIHKQQQSKLSNIDWDILENPCHEESAAKLESVEDSILQEHQTLQRLYELEKGYKRA